MSRRIRKVYISPADVNEHVNIGVRRRHLVKEGSGLRIRSSLADVGCCNKLSEEDTAPGGIQGLVKGLQFLQNII